MFYVHLITLNSIVQTCDVYVLYIYRSIHLSVLKDYFTIVLFKTKKALKLNFKTDYIDVTIRSRAVKKKSNLEFS